MKQFSFTITISGNGENSDEAWLDACESFSMDYGSTPSTEKTKEETENLPTDYFVVEEM